MAEVRLRLRREIHGLLKSVYALPLYTGNKYATKFVEVARTLPLCELPETQNDHADVEGTSVRQVLEPGSPRRSTDFGLYARHFEERTDCLPENVTLPERERVCNGRSAVPDGAQTLTGCKVATGIISVGPEWSGQRARRGPPSSFRAPYIYGLSRCCVTLLSSDGGLSRAYSGTGAWEVPLYKSKRAYYDILGVSPSATHAQIKTAYYKQSFIYHPDKNAGSDEATSRFSQISEAYNVLGNKVLRRKYDRGILSHADVQGSSRPSGTAESASRPASTQHARTRSSPTASARAESTFDFDAFYRAHYGEQLQREKQQRARREELKRKNEQTFKDWKMGRMMEMTVGFMVAMAVAILFSLKQ